MKQHPLTRLVALALAALSLFATMTLTASAETRAAELDRTVGEALSQTTLELAGASNTLTCTATYYLDGTVAIDWSIPNLEDYYYSQHVMRDGETIWYWHGVIADGIIDEDPLWAVMSTPTGPIAFTVYSVELQSASGSVTATCTNAFDWLQGPKGEPSIRPQ